jgi:alkylhydroperoxidase/carboxymuconolactone decarboxylase family protein YurZ
VTTDGKQPAPRPPAPDALRLLLDADADFTRAWLELRKQTFDAGALDPVTRELIVVAADLAAGNDVGTLIHVEAALAAGASAADVLETFKLVAFVLGAATIGRIGTDTSRRLGELLHANAAS